MEEIDYYKLWEHATPVAVFSGKEIQKLAEVMKDLPEGALIHVRKSYKSAIGTNFFAYVAATGQTYDITDYESW